MCGIFCYIHDKENFLNTQYIRDQLHKRGPDCLNSYNISIDSYEINFVASVLHIRGKDICKQPQISNHNILLWNGEIFDGIDLTSNQSDTEILFKLLDHEDTNLVFNKLKGPFAFIYWQSNKNILWFGKDVIGRRSLLLSKNINGSLILSSIFPQNTCNHEFIELNPGLYKLHVKGDIPFNIHYYPYKEIIACPYRLLSTTQNFGQSYLDVMSNIFSRTSKNKEILSQFTYLLYRSAHLRLRSSVVPKLCRRCKSHPNHAMNYNAFGLNHNNNINGKNFDCAHSKIAILFSGGIDCLILACLIDDLVDTKDSIDLLNVVFYDDQKPRWGKLIYCKTKTYSKDNVTRDLNTDIDGAKDRINAKKAYEYLGRRSKGIRNWNFVEVDVSKETLLSKLDEINQLMLPGTGNTILDGSIGPAFYFAARGIGYVESITGSAFYDSPAQVLFSGFGADELLAGYTKHRMIFKHGGLDALQKEILNSVKNMYERNLGRDDRVISCHGKEVRYPYLDEDLVSFLLSLPVEYKADLNLPPGIGDKMLLRTLGKAMSIPENLCSLPKKAIQFGSNIAKIQ
ncbi:unnamed protein product [Gordionus sp. m RMFG-2023]